jgi:hypothetical protein
MGNINSTQPFTDAAATITHPLLAQRIQGLTATDFEIATIATPAARVRYIMLLLKQGQLSAKSCLLHIVDTSAPMDHEADHVEAFLRHLLDQIRLRTCNTEKRRYVLVADLVYRKGTLLGNKDSTTAEGEALRKVAVEARQRLLDMERESVEAEAMRRDAGSEDGAR